MVSPITPLHFSIAGKPREPRQMDRMVCGFEMVDGLTEVALSIFTDCVNAGQPFQKAILAIYLSGLEHGQAITKEK